MRKHATVVHHAKGFFLAINGDLNRRELNLDYPSGFPKRLNTAKKFYLAIIHNGMGGCKSGFSSYDMDPIAIVTEYDLSNPNNIFSIDDIWDPSTHKINASTGEIVERYENKTKFIPDADPVLIINENKNSITEIMKTKQENIRKESLQSQIDEVQQAKKAEANRKRREARAFDKAWNEAYAYNAELTKIKEYNKMLNVLKQRKQVEDEAPATEASQNNNPLKSNTMENQAEVKSTVTNGKPFVKRARRGLAKGTEIGIVLTTDALIGGLIVGSDLLFTMAECVAWGQAVAIKPLGLHPDATRRELKEQAIDRAERRTSMVYAVPTALVKLPSKIIAMKRASKHVNDANIIDINNTEVVS